MTRSLCLRITIDGAVQGVGFRYSLKKEALSLGLDGWVKNNTDGSVTALVQGPRQMVLGLVDWSRKGPPMSMVTSVDIAEKPVDPGLKGFDIVFS